MVIFAIYAFPWLTIENLLSTCGVQPKYPCPQVPRPSKGKKRLSQDEIEAELQYDSNSATNGDSDEEYVIEEAVPSTPPSSPITPLM